MKVIEESHSQAKLTIEREGESFVITARCDSLLLAIEEREREIEWLRSSEGVEIEERTRSPAFLDLLLAASSGVLVGGLLVSAGRRL